jgi:hypothetical protein
MATTTFDTLKFANTLKAAGVPDKQAEAQASVLGDALAVNFKEPVTKDDLAATKDDLMTAIGSLRAELQNDIRQTGQRLDAKIENLEQRLDAKIENLEQRLTAKLENHTAKIEGQITLLKWMIGLSISLSVAVLIRLFIMRVP